MNILLEELEREGHRTATTPMKGVRELERIAQGEAPFTEDTTRLGAPVEDIRNVMGNKTSSMGGSIEEEPQQALARKESKMTKDSGLASTYAPTEAPTEVQEEED